jgi:hypothetical protein
MYCGADVFLNLVSSSQPSINLANLLGMARTASLAGNFSEAESYYNRVLELDPRNSESWIGKGKSAGWQSTIENIRINEMIVAFNNAIGASDKEGRDSIIESCVDEMNRFVVAFYGTTKEWMREFVAVEGVWGTYLVKTAQLLEGLESAALWDPSNQTNLENIVYLCKENIEGFTFRDPNDHNIPKCWSLSSEYEKLLRKKLEIASEKIKQLDPGYVTPTIETKQPESCFVITATMGDENHPAVVLLREFRSEFLSGTIAGELFIHWYHKNGPKLARIIKASPTVRVLSLFIIVAPAAFIASTLIYLKRK